MTTKILKLLIICAISFSFAQNNLLNVTIEGMHCAGGCAKMIENSLNQNNGITAAVDFNNSSATIIYDSEIFSEAKILGMINSYRNGKFTASNILANNNSLKCSKGKNCCQKNGKNNPSCASSNNKKKNANSLAGMIPGHTGCTKSCCSSKK